MPTISGTVYDSTGAAAAGRIVRAYRRDTGAFLGQTTTGTGLITPGDANFSSVSLLLNGNGKDGSTTVVDRSPIAKTLTAVGNAKISTAQSMFGGASIFFDGSGDYLTTPSHVDFDFGTADFTMEAWIYYLGGAIFPVIFGRQEPGTGMAMQFRIVGSALDLTLRNPGGSGLVSVTGGSVPTNAWTHVACSRQDTAVRLFVGGSLVASGVSSNNITASRPLTVGAVDDTTVSGFFTGYIDEARLTKGVARYTSAFTPPDVAFANYSEIPAAPVGTYTISTSYSGECNVICLDDDAGTVYNDLIKRVTPA